MTRPPRPWYRKKRWWAAALLWLAVSYPASLGPVGYARGYYQRGYNPPVFYTPILPPNRAIFLQGGDLRHDIGRYYVRAWEAGAARSPYPPVP